MKHLLDIETFKTHFECSVKVYRADERLDIQVNQYRDDRKELKNYLRTFDGFLITFNGVFFDQVVLAYIDIHDYWINETWDVFCQNVKDFADILIHTDDEMFKYKFTNYRKFKFTSIDVYLFWAKLLRLSKKISLKALGIQLGYPTVQELPYPPDIQELSKEQINEIHHYCSIHDLGILELVAIQLEGVPGQTTVSLGILGTIALRNQVKQDFGINCFSMDAPKIALEALVNEYCRLTGYNKREFVKQRFQRPTIKFGELFQEIEFGFSTKLFQEVFNDWMNSVDTYSKEFVAIPLTTPAIKISTGIGGLHNILSNKVYFPLEDEYLYDIDIASLYPRLILNYKAFRFPEMLQYYDDIRLFRLTETKPALKKYKGTTDAIYWLQKDLFYKVVLNGISGHLDSVNSCLYYPEGIMKVRCGGQLILLTIIEKCIKADIEVIQCNTDGITIRIKKNRLAEFQQFVKIAEEQHNIEFEDAYYKKMIFSNVNSYLAIDLNDNIKQKGEFVTKPELGNSTDNLIIPMALNEYFINGINPREFIKDSKHHIYLFCMSKKADKSYQVYHNGKLQQRLNRYYASTNGAYLYKCRYDEKKKTKKKVQSSFLFDSNEYLVTDKTVNPATGIPFGMSGSHLLGDSGVTIYNNHVSKPIAEYGINYNYYISQVTTKIAEIELNT